MKPVKSTYRIVALKCLNRNVDMEWSDWAAEMMVRGYEAEYLIELAGISEPFNQFELKELTDKVFEELNIDYKNYEKIVIDYATYCLKIGIEQKRPIISLLEELKNLCIELDYETSLYDFYSLYFAKDDLNHSDFQCYWNNADRNNIDDICMRYFEKWLIQHPLDEYVDEV